MRSRRLPLHSVLLVAAILSRMPAAAQAQMGPGAPARVSGPVVPSGPSASTGTGNLWSQTRALPKNSFISGTIDAAKLYNTLHKEGMGNVAGCNYIGYLKLADTLADLHMPDFSLSKLRAWRPWGDNGVPLTDYVGTALKGLGGYASKKSAQSQEETLIYQIETVCNALKQAHESERIARLMAASREGIGTTIKGLADEAGLSLPKLTHLSGKALAEQWLKTSAVNQRGKISARDSLAAMSLDFLATNLTVSDQLEEQVKALGDQLQELRRALNTYAMKDSSTGRWRCPAGDYADPNSPTTPLSKEPATRGRPICGPATPERASQVRTQAKLLIARARLIELTAAARTVGADAILAATEDLDRRALGYVTAYSLRQRP